MSSQNKEAGYDGNRITNRSWSNRPVCLIVYSLIVYSTLFNCWVLVRELDCLYCKKDYSCLLAEPDQQFIHENQIVVYTDEQKTSDIK